MSTKRTSPHGTLLEGSTNGAPLPVLRTEVVALLDGPLARVILTQHFFNDCPGTIEAFYVMPLAHTGAVSEIILRVGDRCIRGRVRERAEARAIYEQARSAGVHGALLEQERPDLFSLSVANVAPGEQLSVEIVVHEALSYDDGAFRFVFPVVAPHRFLGPETPDASRLALARGPGGEALVRELSLRVDGQFSAPLAGVRSLAHPMKLTSCDLEQGRFSLVLSPEVTLTETDVTIEIRLASRQLTPLLQVHQGAGPGAPFLLTLVPDADVEPERIGARELIFVIDRSGSMAGASFLQARRALKSCLRGLGPDDTFHVLVFNERVEALWLEALPWSQRTLELADTFLDHVPVCGGTNISEAMKAALTLPCDPQRTRQVVFLTDGGVSNEAEVLSGIERDLGNARIYAFGVGSSVNRGLLEGMARSGRGSVEFLFPGQDLEPVMLRFQARIAFPLLTDISLSFEPDLVEDVAPDKIPDLFVGQPVQVTGLFLGDGPRTMRLRGKLGSRGYEQELPCPVGEQRDGDNAVARVWARRHIDALLERARKNPSMTEALRREVVQLGVAHGLVTPFTSLVAIDDVPAERVGSASRRVLPERTAPLQISPPPSVLSGSGTLRVPAVNSELLEASLRRRGFWPLAQVAPAADDRMADLFRALNTLSRNAEKLDGSTEAKLEQRLQELNALKVKIRDQLVVLLPESRLLAAQAEEETALAVEWRRRAEQASQAGDDELALDAHSRGDEHTRRALEHESRRQAQLLSIEQLKKNYRLLNDKIEEAKRNKIFLKARLARAKAQNNIGSTLHSLKDSSAFDAFERIAAKIEQEHGDSSTTPPAENSAFVAEKAAPDGRAFSRGPSAAQLPPQTTVELGQTQRASGAWGRDGRDDLRRTCLALVLMALAGQTHRSGLYRPHLRRAMDFVNAHLDSCDEGDLLFVVWALREVARRTEHPRDLKLLGLAAARLPASNGGQVGAYARGEITATEADAWRLW